MRIAIYLRSATTLDGGSTALLTQQQICDALVLQHGWEVVARYQDTGGSANTLDRPGLRQLLADAQAHCFDGVVVYRLDRLSRRLDHFATIVQQLEREHIHLISVEEPVGWEALRDEVLTGLGIGEGVIMPHTVPQMRLMRRPSWRS